MERHNVAPVSHHFNANIDRYHNFLIPIKIYDTIGKYWHLECFALNFHILLVCFTKRTSIVVVPFSVYISHENG